jgi:hypothetical protein
MLMVTSLTQRLAAGAAFFGGVLAGATANRALVQLPAFERIGVLSWANLIRAENHGVGSFFYIVIGLVALLLTIGTAIAFRFDRSARDLPKFPAYAAAVLAVASAVVTRAILVPAMFGMRAAGDNVTTLQRIFSINARWWGVNDLLHVFTFALNLWVLIQAFSVPQSHLQTKLYASPTRGQT